MRNISPSPAVVLTKTSPLSDLIFLHGIRTTRRPHTGEEIFYPSSRVRSRPQSQAGISSYTFVFDRFFCTRVCVCARARVCVCVCVGWSQPGILQIGKTIGTLQEQHEGRHRQQQHSQHLPSQESCGAAEDGGLHG